MGKAGCVTVCVWATWNRNWLAESLAAACHQPAYTTDRDMNLSKPSTYLSINASLWCGTAWQITRNWQLVSQYITLHRSRAWNNVRTFWKHFRVISRAGSVSCFVSVVRTRNPPGLHQQLQQCAFSCDRLHRVLESWATAKMTAWCALYTWVPWKFLTVPEYAYGYFSGNF